MRRWRLSARRRQCAPGSRRAAWALAWVRKGRKRRRGGRRRPTVRWICAGQHRTKSEAWDCPWAWLAIRRELRDGE